MNLLEFTRIVNKIFHSTKNPKDYEVVITTSDNSVGPRGKADIKFICRGIDWEMRQIRIEPKEELVKKDK